MSRKSYTGVSIAHLVGTTFRCTWGKGETEVSIQINPKTKKPAYKVSTSYFNNVNQVGWYLKGKLDECKIDSRLRPNHLVDKVTGKTLKELRMEIPNNVAKVISNTPVKTKVFVKKEMVKAQNLSKLTDVQKVASKELLVNMKRSGEKTFSKEYIYGFLKEKGLDFLQRKEVGRCLIADRILEKVNNNYTFGSIWRN